MKTVVLTSETSKDHYTGSGHPERPDRVSCIIKNLKKISKDKIAWETSSYFDKYL